MEKPLVNQKYLLKKFPGKGGWTYADLPQVSKNENVPFGWVKVRGAIDGYEIKKINLMPYGGDKLFLPVKAEIRKAIKKGEGDYVHIVLYLDNEPTEIPEEMQLCLRDEPMALKVFTSISESEKQNYIRWIYSAKQEETKVERMAESINRLMKGLKFYDKSKD